MAVHQYTYQHAGPWTQHARPSCTHISTLVHGLSTLSVQYTQDVCVCQHTLDVRVCTSAHTGRRLWLSISTHISTLVLGLSTLTLPVDCSGDFGQRGLFVQYTQDVRGCLLAHTGRPWLSVCVRQHTQASVAVHHTQDVRVCPPAHTGHGWLSVSTHGMSVAVRVCPFVSVSTHRTSVGVRQHTQDVRVCPSAHTGHLWLSVCVSQHTQDICGCPSVHISVGWSLDSARWPFPWTVWVILAHVGCLFSTHRTSLGVRQHTQDVCGCPWLSVSTHRTSVANRVCLCVSICVRQHTQDVRVCPSAHTGRPWLSVSTHRTSVAVRVCPSAHTGRPWLSISTHISTLVLGLSTLTLPVDCSGDFGQRGLSVQYTQDVRGCLPAHTGRPWLSVCVRQHTQASVAVHHTQDVRVCPPAHTGRRWLSVSTHRMSMAVRGCPFVSVNTPDICGCPSAHTRCPCVSVSTHRTSVAVHQYTYHTHSTSLGVRQHTQDVCGCPWLSVSTHRTSVANRVCLCVSICVRQHTQDVRVCPSAHTGRPWLSVSIHRTSVAVRVCPSAHTGRLWLSISTHISTLGLGLSTLTLPVDCSGDFGQRGLFVQYTQDVRGCLPAHTGRPWLSVCVRQHTQASVAVHHTQDVRVCPPAHTGHGWLSVSTHGMSVAVRVCPFVSVSTHRTSVGVRQHTQDFRVCPSAHTGHLWLSVCVSQHTQDICGCPSVHISVRWSLDSARWPFPWTVWVILAHVGCLFSTHRTSLGVRQHTQDVCGCPWLSVSTHRTSVANRVCLCVSICVRQHTQDVRVCPSAHTGRPWLSVSTHRTSVAVRVCPSAHTGRPWLSISTHISTLVLGLSTLTLPVDCSGDFGQRGLSVQYTQDVRGCLPAHTGRPWLSVCVRQHTQASVAVHHTQDVRVCPPAHTGRRWLSVSTHRMSMAVRGCPFVSVNTPDICGCPSAHTRCPCVSVSTHRTSVAVRVCPSVSVSTHRTSVSVHQYTYQYVGPWTQHAGPSRGLFGTHISTLVLGLSTLALPVDCSGDFGPRGLSLHYTEDVRGCSSAHTGRPCVSVSTHRTFVAVHVCPCVSVSTHRTSVAVPQYTYQHVGPWTQHAGPSRGLFGTSVAVRVCPSAHTGRPWLSISTHISTLVLGLSTLTLPVDCSGDFGQRGLSVQYTQDVRGCPPAHTGRPWLSVCVRQHTQASVAVHHTQDVRVCPPAHTGHGWLSVSTHRMSVAVRVCPFVSVSTHRTSVGVRQHTQDFRVCPSAHTGHLWLSVCVSQHTQDICGCPSVHISVRWSLDSARWPFPWTVWVILAHVGCLFSTHRTSLGVRQHTQDVCGCPWLSVSTHRTSVANRVCLCVSICVRQHTQDVRVCPSAHTGRPWLSVSTHRTSVAVRVCPSAHTGRPCLSISTHISTLVLGLSTLTLPVDCSGDFGQRGLSVQYTQDVRGCLPAHTGRPWLSVCVRQHTQASVAVHHTQDVRVCPPAHTGRRWLSVSTHRMSMAVRGCPFVSVNTPDICGCPSAHTRCPCVSVSTHRTSVAVRVCPSVSVSTHRTSVAVHQYTYQYVGPWTQHAGPSRGLFGTHISTLVLGLSTLALPVDCSGDFGPRGLSLHYTEDVRGCSSAHTGRPCVSVSTHRTFVAVHVCPCVSVSTHRTSVAVPQYTYQHDVRGCPPAHTGRLWLSVRTHRTSVAVRVCPSAHTGRPWLSISTHISTLVLGLSTLTLPVDCSGDFGQRGLSVQYTQDVRGCPPAHTGRPWLSVCVRQHTQASVAVHHTQDVRVCPPAHTGHGWLSVSTHRMSVAVRVCPFVSVSTHRTSVGVRQHTQDVRVCPSAHTGHLWLSVCVSQHTQDICGCPSVHISDVRGCPPAHTGHLWLSVRTHRTSMAVCVCLCVSICVRQHTQDVRVCPSAHTGRPWLSISTHISTLVLGLSMLTLPVDCLGDFGQRGLSVQYTQDVRGTHISTLVLGLSTLALPVDCSGDFSPRGLSVHYTEDVCGCSSAHTGRPCKSVSTHRMSVAVHVCPCVSVSTHRTSVAVHHTHRTSVGVRQHTHKTSVAVRVCPSVSASTHKTSVAIHQYTYQHHTLDVRGCPSAHTGCLWPSVCVRQHTQDVCGCPSVLISARWSLDSARRPFPWTVRPTQDVPWLSISTHIATLVFGLSTLALPVDCLGDFGPRGLSVQYKQDVHGCLPAHKGRPWLSVSTHRTSVAVRVCLCVSICVRQHTQDVCGCPLAHTGRQCLSASTHRSSVAVRVCPSEHTCRLWLSISTHISTLVLGLSTLDLPVDCSGDFSPRGLSVHYTEDVCGCSSAHTRNPCMSVSTHRTSVAVHVCPCVSVSTHRTSVAVHHTHRTSVGVRQHTHKTSVAVRVCPSVSASRHKTSVAIHQYTYQHVGPWTQHAGPSRILFGTSVAVRVCPSAHTGSLWLSISTHISTLVLGLSTQTLPVDCSGDFGPCGLSVQYAQDVCGCLCVSVCVRLYLSAHTGRPWLSISTHIGTLVFGLSTLALPVDCLGDFGPRGLSVQYTQDVHGCLPAHKGRPWLSVSTHRTSVAVRLD
ncbi:hypothetical protein YC2023_066232 [Brassica napus]